MLVDQSKFGRWLRQGHQHAIEWISCNNSLPYRNQILEACHFDLRYDPQCEEFRGPFLITLLKTSGEPMWFLNEILRTLEDSADPEIDYGQLFWIVAEFAPNQIEALKTCFLKLGFDHAGLYAAEVIVKLAGRDGLLLVCQSLDTVDESDRPWVFESLLDCLPAEQRDDPFPPHVNRFLLESQFHEQEIETQPPTPWPDFAEIRDQIRESGRKFFNSYWAKRAPPEELLQAAAALRDETDPDQICGLLRLFARVPFPGTAEFLLCLIDLKDPDLRLASLAALKNLSLAPIRELALSMAQSASLPPLAVAILKRNGGPADYPVIERLLILGSDDEIHNLGYSVLDFAKAHPDPAAIPAISWVYENSPCSHCIATAKELLEKSMRREPLLASPTTATRPAQFL